MPKSTQKKSIKQRTQEIKDTEAQLSKNRAFNTKAAIKQGRNFIGLKKLLKKKKINFQAYNKKNFPHLLPETIQRYMKLAKYVDLKAFPTLSILSQNQLKLLIIHNNKTDVGEYLEGNDFNLDFDPKDLKKSADFKTKVDDLIKYKKKPEKKSVGKKKSYEVDIALEIVNKWAEKRITAKSHLPKNMTTLIKELHNLLTKLLAMPNSDK